MIFVRRRRLEAIYEEAWTNSNDDVCRFVLALVAYTNDDWTAANRVWRKSIRELVKTPEAKSVGRRARLKWVEDELTAVLSGIFKMKDPGS